MSYTREQLYDLVNACETFDDLIAAIKIVAEAHNGKVPNSSKNTELSRQLVAVFAIRGSLTYDFRVLTRSFGIRQQAMYLKHCGEK
jgi:hypothetical protein